MQSNILSKNLLKHLNNNEGFSTPDIGVFNLPEKVLQFGTGVLLRGLPDQYIDQANRRGTFNGRVVVIKTTAQGSLLPYRQQDCLYSICMRGKVGEQLIDETYINASISRVLNAQEDWNAIKEFSTSPDLQLVISNTTEVGIVYDAERIDADMPSSFPGKLLALLHHRYQYYKGDLEKGLVILPAELIEYNGDKLREVLKQLIAYNELEQGFVNWFNASVVICNTLVDRIVPGKLSEGEHKEKEIELGYKDELMISCEPFGLWVIESTDERVKKAVGFADDATGCKVVPSIHKYKELKLRMLNATHTFSCAISILAGIRLVRESMSDSELSAFIADLVLQEIKDVIVSNEIPEDEAIRFGKTVLDRFANPFLDHKWDSIASQYALKMQGRCVPLIFAYHQKRHSLPFNMLVGLAAYLVWFDVIPDEIPQMMCEEKIWGGNLAGIPGLSEHLKTLVQVIRLQGVRSVINNPKIIS